MSWRIREAGFVAVLQDSRCIGEEDELLRLKRSRQLSGHGIGVDVVGQSVGVGSNAGDDRDVSTVQKRFEDSRVDRSHIAYQTVGTISEGACPHQGSITARKPHGFATDPVQPVHDLLVDTPDQHHFHHIHGGGVGDSQTVPEMGFDRHLAQPVVDLGSSAVHHHRLYAHTGQQGHITEHRIAEIRLDHGRASVLHHHPATSEALDVRQSLTQNGDPRAVFLADERIGTHGAAAAVESEPEAAGNRLSRRCPGVG